MHLNNTLHCRLLFTCLRKEKNRVKKFWKRFFPCWLKGKDYFAFWNYLFLVAFLVEVVSLHITVNIRGNFDNYFFTIACLAGLGKGMYNFSFTLWSIFNVKWNTKGKICYILFFCEFDLTLQFLGLITWVAHHDLS